jgi:hypothetical protein
MPRSLSLKREATELSLTSGKASRWLKVDFSHWQFDALNTSLVTPMVAVNNECDTPLYKDSHDNHSINVSMGDATEILPDRCNGNCIIHLPRLLSAAQECTTCWSCAEQMVEELFESFICYCEKIITNLINMTQHRYA